MSTKNLLNWTDPGIAEEAMNGLRREMHQAGEDPDSGIAMCHRQGKTAVYLPSGQPRTAGATLREGTPLSTTRPSHA